MRRENRNMRNLQDGNNFKNILYLAGSILGVAIIAFVITFVLYSNKLNEEAKMSKLNSEKIVGLVPNEEDDKISEDISEVNSKFGKTVEESQNEVKENNVVETNTNKQNSVQENVINNSVKEETKESVSEKENKSTQKDVEKSEENKTQEKKELEFSMPVEGEISKNYAKDSLVYSDTLQEWVVHLGIDIKAEKTTVVKSAEAGKVKAIKNDPRYGLTVILEHDNGYSSVYSNLLTAEFVKEGEKVEKGQTIGTVGNTATFEISEESHLHFEILKDGESVDPNIYLK